MQNSTEKPIDRWLALAGISMGIIFFLVPKTPIVIIVCLVFIFVLLLHPIWNFWWIEKTQLRRIVVVIFFAVLLIFFGYYIWPPLQSVNEAEPKAPKFIQLKQPTAEEIAAEVAKRLPRQSPATQNKKNRARSFLQVDIPSPVEGTVSTGSKMAFNIYWRNMSQERVFDILTLSKLYTQLSHLLILLQSPDTTGF